MKAEYKKNKDSILRNTYGYGWNIFLECTSNSHLVDAFTL